MIVELHERDTHYPDLTPGQPYAVLGIEADNLRILNDQGRPYLYPHRIFVVVNAREPSDWVNERADDNERYAYPLPLNGAGFFEDYFDDKPEAVATFWRIINQRLSTTP